MGLIYREIFLTQIKMDQPKSQVLEITSRRFFAAMLSYQCRKEAVCGDQAYATPDNVDARRPDHLEWHFF
jgi:hypothetical protein